jgi:hypothetical protein
MDDLSPRRRPQLPGDWLADVAILVMAGIALAHGQAARLHFADVVEHREMGMTAEAAIVNRIGWLLVASVVVGLAIAAWGIYVARARHTLTAWAVTSLVAYGAMVAAGIASRTVGLLGHADDFGPLWAVTVAAEIAVLVLVASHLAAVRAAEQGVAFGGAIARTPIPTTEPAVRR